METLAERITREGPVNELDAVGWIVRLAKKLESMHSRGLAHGGISPDAMKTASASRLSLGMLIPTGAARNRLEFRSPERLETGNASETDDTWSTAATLYALITGKSPFVAADDDTVRKKVRAGAFAPLSSFDVGDDDLQHIIEAALNPSLASRTSSLAAFRKALEGWHPDSKVRDLPPMVDDQPEDDDDEDARTVMRPVSAADAVRALIAQREQAAHGPESAPQSVAKPVASNANESAAKPAPAPVAAKPAPAPVAAKPAPAPVAAKPAPAPTPAQNHGLLEDDEEAATAMISVPPLAYLASKAPATTPAPPPADMKSGPTSAPSSSLGTMRGPASNALARPSRPSSKATVAGGFTAKQILEQHHQQLAQQQAKPLAPPVPGISRDAVLDDVDNEATVMREAPLDVLRKATASIAPPAGDRTTPVDPTSARVAATTADLKTPPPANPAPEDSLASISMIDNASERGAAVEPRETPVSPSRGLDVKAMLGGAGPDAAKALAGQTPVPAAEKAPTPGLATSSLTAPSTPGMPAPQAPAPAAPLAKAPADQAPIAAEIPPQTSALKGLFIGIGLALVIIAIATGVYFFVVKH